MTLRVCLMAALLCPALALAKKPAAPTADKPPAAKHLSYDEGDELIGDLHGPDGSAVSVAPGSKHPSLMKVRTTFIPELLKRAEDI